jgi:two-component system chemotaxis sensor kinase CheA
MSHELRTPLNAISGYSELFLDKISDYLKDPATADISVVDFQLPLNRILTSGKRLLVLINDILDLSKIEANKSEVFPKEFNPSQSISTIASTTAVLRNNDVQLSLNLSPDLPPTIVTDQSRFEQILTNLLGNAFKFTSSGSVTVQAAPTAHHCIQVDVTDTGPGIPASALELIFEPFQQLDGSPTRQHGGTGLGLSIAKQLTTLLGGTLSVRSILHNGTTFTLILPVEYNHTQSQALQLEGITA